MIVAHKIALDPTDKQATYFAKACGCARLACNWALAEWREQYAMGGQPSQIALRRLFNSIKGERFPFVLEVTKCACQCAIQNLGRAFEHFFRRAKEGEEECGYPKFKKKGNHDAFSIGSPADGGFAVRGNRLRVPRLGWVRMREALRFSGKIISATISRTADRWFVSIAVDMPDPTPPKRENQASVGVDWGVTNFATLSTGEVVEGPKPHKALLDRLKRLNRSLHRKVLGSKNREKAKRKVARLHARIANIRNDFLHKFTTDLVHRFSVVGIEDLNVSGMTKNHSLARSILDQAPYEMRRQLGYKCPMRGSTLAPIPRFEPSSKKCSDCGHVLDSLPLSVREWDCPACGKHHDRDVNAGKNIERIAVGSTVTTSGRESAGGGNATAVKLARTNEEPDAADSNGIGG